MTALLLALMLIGCDAEPRQELGCVDAADCPGLAVCTDAGTCEDVQCLDSTQCPIGTFCMPEFHQCFSGCGADDDCFAGEVCDVEAAQCVPAACEDPEIDCRIGEICSDDGGCEVPDDLCGPCGSECSATGGRCVGWNGEWMCLPGCDPSDPAPRGFTCEEGTSGWTWEGTCADVVRE